LLVTVPLRGVPIPYIEGQIFSWCEDVYTINEGRWICEGERQLRGKVLSTIRRRGDFFYIIEVFDVSGKAAHRIQNMTITSKEGFPIIERKERFLSKIVAYHDVSSQCVHNMKRKMARKHRVQENNIKVIQKYFIK